MKKPMRKGGRLFWFEWRKDHLAGRLKNIFYYGNRWSQILDNRSERIKSGLSCDRMERVNIQDEGMIKSGE